jgi:hypothetical protein
MSFAPASPPASAPVRRRRRGLALALGAALLLHGLLLAGLRRERPPSPRPGPLPATALWTRSLAAPPPDAAPAPAPAATPEATRPGAERPRALAAVPRAEAVPPPARRELSAPSPAPAAASGLEAAAAPPPAPAATAADADSDEADAAAAGGSAPPLYAPRLPGPALLRFELRRGPQRGRAQLLWQPAEDRYTIGFDAQAGGRPFIEQRSTGRNGPHGLAPELFRDKRRGRSAQEARFDADGQRITFHARAPDLPLWPGAQDRLGWIVQLAGIVAAAAAPPDEVRLFVVGARGGAGPWTFVARGAVEVASPLGPVQALHYERAPAVLRDQRVEAWLDPARGYWPVKLRFTPVLGGPPLELLLEGEPAKP